MKNVYNIFQIYNNTWWKSCDQKNLFQRDDVWCESSKIFGLIHFWAV